MRLKIFDALLPMNAVIHVATEICGVRTPCKFPNHCSQFAREELKKEQSLWRSFYRIMLRLVACSPLHDISMRRGWVWINKIY